MAHVIRIALPMPKEQLLREAATRLPAHGFTFAPTAEGGDLTGHGFAGTVRVTDAELEIVIEKKPVFLPWPLVEAKIRAFFAHPR